ncbi:MAG: hypothetical protein WAQ25_03410 [Candidatus Saccharimonas sp.]
MMNLAGNTDADRQIGYELRLADIPIVDATAEEAKYSEVPFTLAGQLGEFRFLRCWYYWEVTGKLPLHVANLLYADSIGKRDVRVAGHCGRPSPEKWAVPLLADDSCVLPENWGNTQTGLSAEDRQHLDDLKDIYGPNPVLHDDPAAKDAKLYVTSYHIDSQEGLDLFCRMVREYCGVTV